MGNDEDFDWEDFGKWAIRLLIIGLVIGAIVLAWVMLLGPAFNQASYNNFNNSPQHINAIAQRFGNDCLQLAETSDPVTIKAIDQDIYQASETVDVNSMDMPSGTRACVNRAIQTVTGGH